MNRSDLSKKDITALAKAARLELSDERTCVMVKTMPGIITTLDVPDGAHDWHTRAPNV